MQLYNHRYNIGLRLSFITNKINHRYFTLAFHKSFGFHFILRDTWDKLYTFVLFQVSSWFSHKERKIGLFTSSAHEDMYDLTKRNIHMYVCSIFEHGQVRISRYSWTRSVKIIPTPCEITNVIYFGIILRLTFLITKWISFWYDNLPCKVK